MKPVYKKYIFKGISILAAWSLSNTLFAQEATPAAAPTTSNGLVFDVNMALALCAILFTAVNYVLYRILSTFMDIYREKHKALLSGKTTALVLGFLLLSGNIFAQDAAAKTTEAVKSSSFLGNIELITWALILLIVFEFIILLVLIKWIKFFSGIDTVQKEQEAIKGARATIWEKMNQFKPIEQEADLDTGHSYDGIRELNNITPPWFTTAFVISIIFAIVYLWRYHIAEAAPLQIEEYEIEMAEAKKAQEEYLKTQANNIDENTVTMLGAADIEAGKKLYASNCTACHGAAGGGGVGPNLTDKYWIHGGGIKDVFKSIKYGWVEKGMKSWKDDFSPSQIAQLTSYVETLKGTNPAGAKEAQGDLYTEGAATETATTKDSSATATPVDTTKK